MILSATTQQILDELEMITGLPVNLMPNANLRVSTTVKAARGSAPAHFLSYKPSIQGLDYAIAFQCSFLLRIYQTPPEDRFDFVGKEEGRNSVYNSLAGPNGTLKTYNLPDAAIKTATDQVFDGIMTQIRYSASET